MSDTTPQYLELGELLRRARVRKFLEQHVLAALLGVTDRTVRDWEKGYARPSLVRFPSIADALDLDAVELAELADNLERQPGADAPEGGSR